MRTAFYFLSLIGKNVNFTLTRHMGLGPGGVFMMYTPELSTSLCKREQKADYGNANNTMIMLLLLLLLLLSLRFLPLLVFVVVVVVSVVAALSSRTKGS